MRDPLSVGVFRYPRYENNQLDSYIKQEQSLRAAAAKKKSEDAFEDVDMLGDVWERDIDNLTKDFMTFRNKRKEYEQEKDATKKAQLWQEGVKLGAQLETNITKSKKNKQQYLADTDRINKDNKFLLPEDAPTTLEKWASTTIYDRPDDTGVRVPSNLDFGEEAKKRFWSTIKKPDVKSTKVRGGGVDVTNKVDEYSPEDVEAALTATYENMPGNFIRAQKQRLMFDLNNGTPTEMREAADALKDADSLEAYLKKLIYRQVQPGLKIKTTATAPSPAKGTGSGGSAKQSYTVTTGQESRGGVMYTNVFSAPKNKTPVTTNWQIPTQLLKDANAKYKLGLDDELSEIDVNATPTVEISGTFSKVTRNQKTGDITVSINPKQFIDKFFTTNTQITLPLGEENEAPVKAFLNDEDYRQLIEAEEKKKRVPGKKRTAPTPPGAGGSVKEEKATPPKGQRGKFNSKTGKIEYQ